MSLSKEQLMAIITKLHQGCFRLIINSIGKPLPVAGNVAIFCQSQEEFTDLSGLSAELTKQSDDPSQKYYPLKEPVIVPPSADTPGAEYSYLCVRQPSEDSPQLGDIDFILPPGKYENLKTEVRLGKIAGASIYDRPGWDMIEFRNSDIPVLAYVSTKEMAEKVRVKF